MACEQTGSSISKSKSIIVKMLLCEQSGNSSSKSIIMVKMLLVCEQTGSSSSRKSVNSSNMVEMLVVCEPVRSTIGAIILVKMLLVCEPSARNVALLGGSSDATFSTFQSQCGSLSSRKSFVSRQVMSPSRSCNYPRFSAHFWVCNCKAYMPVNIILRVM